MTRTLAEYAEEVLRRSVETATGCWQFQGYIKPDGYGQVGRNLQAHRVTWEHLVVPIPAGLHIDHLCRNRGCVNPGHMDIVTPGVNVMRGVGVGPRNAAKTECVNGHPYTPENTYYRPDRFGRMCLICRTAARRRQTIRERAARLARRHTERAA